MDMLQTGITNLGDGMKSKEEFEELFIKAFQTSIKKVNAKLISDDLISVKAMSAPEIRLYYHGKSFEQLMKELAELQQKQEQEAYENNLKEYLEKLWR